LTSSAPDGILWLEESDTWISTMVSCLPPSVLHIGTLQRKSNHATFLLEILQGLLIVFRIKDKLLSMELKWIFMIQSLTLAISPCPAYAPIEWTYSQIAK
jgi:hypothetical protein